MELLLNLLWFAIAVGALSLWLPVSPSHRKQFRLGMGALVCVLALLLPAISVTDDLHFDTFAVEDSNSTKRLVSAAAHVSPMSRVVWFAISLLAFLFALAGPTRRVCDVCVENFPQSTFHSSVSGRAPPCLLA